MPSLRLRSVGQDATPTGKRLPAGPAGSRSRPGSATRQAFLELDGPVCAAAFAAPALCFTRFAYDDVGTACSGNRVSPVSILLTFVRNRNRNRDGWIFRSRRRPFTGQQCVYLSLYQPLRFRRHPCVAWIQPGSTVRSGSSQLKN